MIQFVFKRVPAKLKWTLLWAFIFLLAVFALFLTFDRIFRVDLAPDTLARVVVAEDGTLLRSFADEDGIWRYPATVDQVSDNYIQALIGYEDRWFYYHPGVNPFSLLRALYQWAKNGHVVSGGSTLTMQVARMKRPMSRTVIGKFVQIFTALQLEFHFSKEDILNYYLNHAPFGGGLEGVQAASHAYFDHSAEHLTRAEAALLAVMPQAPTRYRPDLHPDAAQKARNKLLNRLAKFDIWPEPVIKTAKEEKVMGWPVETRMYAPLLARRLTSRAGENTNRIHTFIDYHLQLALEQLARDYAANLPPHVSLAVLVMNNHSGGIKAYCGSADFFNRSRFSHVDMVTAMRSPGSTIKPFIYGMALDRGLIHSQSLLMDVPIHFDDFRPVNFTGGFSGPVSAATALSKSLNLPAVQLMDHLGPRYFYAQMVNSGFTIRLPDGAKPNLSMALGGFSTSLENLVTAYSSLGRNGKTISPRYTKDSKKEQHRLLSDGAAWITHKMLLPESSGPVKREDQWLAVKTGTSYGYRDAWAIGVDKGYTVGVWVGRPDGVPVPEYYGASIATPLLKSVARLLPRHRARLKQPDSVTRCKICWPGGQRAVYDRQTKEYNCENRRSAWILNRTTPKTLTRRRVFMGPAVKELTLRLTKNGKYRVPAGCNVGQTVVETNIVLWPRIVESWLPPEHRRYNKIPPICPKCPQISDVVLTEPVDIRGLSDNEIIQKKEKKNRYPVFDLKVHGGTGPWYWFENSILKKKGGAFRFAPKHAGTYQILVMDQSGAVDRVKVKLF
ncbi:MAG: penicillin-binding protein 1C [Desulfobacteraceae bacterium]|nr:penicillin-binding protein 1C [Desulfobacteraceae bacterium]